MSVSVSNETVNDTTITPEDRATGMVAFELGSSISREKTTPAVSTALPHEYTSYDHDLDKKSTASLGRESTPGPNWSDKSAKYSRPHCIMTKFVCNRGI